MHRVIFFITLFAAIFFIMFVTSGCGVPLYEEFQDDPKVEDIREVQNTDIKYYYDDSIGGMAFFTGNCDYYIDHPFVLDPDWDDDQVYYIRNGVKLWEKSLGIDLGDIEIADKNCSREVRVLNCIVKINDRQILQEMKYGNDLYVSPNYQIFLYVEALDVKGYGNIFLSDLAAHETGHVLGMGHTSKGIMSTNRPFELSPIVSKEDIDEYDRACFSY